MEGTQPCLCILLTFTIATEVGNICSRADKPNPHYEILQRRSNDGVDGVHPIVCMYEVILHVLRRPFFYDLAASSAR